ncbi:MAG TPA: hypothetical protein VHJ17_10555 [Thermomonospora sp.]|nr:hypothetical protein [Thermomonospora sp.]
MVLSSPRAPDDAAIGVGLQSLLVACGVAGQVLYLVAARHGFGVTGVGGFDPAFWNRHLPPGRHAVYLVAFGRPVAADKHDALDPGAHG